MKRERPVHTDRQSAGLHCCWIQSSCPTQRESNSMRGRESLEPEVECIVRVEWAGPVTCERAAYWQIQQRSKKIGVHRSCALNALGRNPQQLGPDEAGSESRVMPRAIQRACHHHDQQGVADHETSNRHQPVAFPSWKMELPRNSGAFHSVSRHVASCEGLKPSNR